MERGFKYRIYPNESQRDQIARTLGCCRFVYNRALDVKDCFVNTSTMLSS